MLPRWNDHDRPSDSDIDPSFPLPPRDWLPELDDPLGRGPEDVVDWVSHGPNPDYEDILKLNEIDGVPGPWVLLDGFIEQRRQDDDRSVFTFIRGLFASPRKLRQGLTEFNRRAYPGNDTIPDPIYDRNTFGGEIPWSARFAYPLRVQSGASDRQIVRAFETHGQQELEGVTVELPVAEFLWDSSRDSSVDNVLTATVPSPALCERLGLVNHARRFDLYDHRGALASICIFHDQGEIYARFAYMREDLLNQYTSETAQAFAWLVWGERTPRPGAPRSVIDKIRHSVCSRFDGIHKRSYVWNGQAPEAQIGLQEVEASSRRELRRSP